MLDYTYLYELDGNKLHCTEPDPQDPSKPCGGIIDYDVGFNKLYCQKCGHWYRVQELAKMPEFKDIINRRSETKMDVIIRRGSTIQHVGEDKEIILPGSTTKIQKPEKEENYASTIQVKPVKKISVPNRNQQTHYQQKKSEPVKPRFETKTDEEFKLKQNKGTGYKKEIKPQYNNNIQRGVVRTTEPVTTDTESKFPIPQPSKKKAPHFKRLSYNPKFKTITMYDNSNDRYVLELGEHDEIIQQIVDGSDYFKNVMSMKQSAFDTLKKNNTDLNIENEKLTSDNKTLVEENQKLQKKVTDLSSNKGLEQAQQRIQELEQQVLDLKEKINSVSESDKNEVPEYGEEEESFNESKYPRVMFTNGEVTTLKKLGRVENDEDDHKVIMLSDDGDINSAASDDQGNLVLIVSINGILVDKYNQLKEAEIADEDAKDEQKEDDEN